MRLNRRLQLQLCRCHAIKKTLEDEMMYATMPFCCLMVPYTDRAGGWETHIRGPDDIRDHAPANVVEGSTSVCCPAAGVQSWVH